MGRTKLKSCPHERARKVPLTRADPFRVKEEGRHAGKRGGTGFNSREQVRGERPARVTASNLDTPRTGFTAVHRRRPRSNVPSSNVPTWDKGRWVGFDIAATQPKTSLRVASTERLFFVAVCLGVTAPPGVAGSEMPFSEAFSRRFLRAHRLHSGATPEAVLSESFDVPPKRSPAPSDKAKRPDKPSSPKREPERPRACAS